MFISGSFIILTNAAVFYKTLNSISLNEDLRDFAILISAVGILVGFGIILGFRFCRSIFVYVTPVLILFFLLFGLANHPEVFGLVFMLVVAYICIHSALSGSDAELFFGIEETVEVMQDDTAGEKERPESNEKGNNSALKG